jgi:hypothetical protein
MSTLLVPGTRASNEETFKCYSFFDQYRRRLEANGRVPLDPTPIRVRETVWGWSAEVFTVDADPAHARVLDRVLEELVADPSVDFPASWEVELLGGIPEEAEGCWPLNRPPPFAWTISLYRG